MTGILGLCRDSFGFPQIRDTFGVPQAGFEYFGIYFGGPLMYGNYHIGIYKNELRAEVLRRSFRSMV